MSPITPALMLLAPATAQDPAQGAVAADALPTESEAWEFSGNLLYSDPPGSEDRLTPILYANRGQLHLEARYNYEDLHTGSVFAGWTFSSGEELTADVTPMLGAVVGDTDGIAPGLEVDLGWKKLSFYTEAEYLIDLDDRDDDYFYSWSTLTYGLTDWLDAGVVTERSRLVDTGLSLQRGLALQMHRGNLGFALYAYNLGSDDSYAVVSLALKL